MSIEEYEVSLIKAMLLRNMRNNEIQFYFNRPDRPVNSGRITEIKKGRRWPEIQESTPDELDYFLSTFNDNTIDIVDTELKIPDQFSAATVFFVDDSGRIAALPDPPGQGSGAETDQLEMYFELRQKVESLLQSGQNILGPIDEPLCRFARALPESMSECSISKLWLRGNTLRSLLRAHDEIKNLDYTHPAKLDRGYAEYLRDIVEAFNIFILTDSKGIELDYQRLGPTGREMADAAIKLARPIVQQASEVATEGVGEILQEQINMAEKAPNSIDGDQVVSLTRRTSSNFVIALVQGAKNITKEILGKEFNVAWRNAREGVYTTVGMLAVTQLHPVLQFIAHHLEMLSSYAKAVIGNPIVSEILIFITKLFA